MARCVDCNKFVLAPVLYRGRCDACNLPFQQESEAVKVVEEVAAAQIDATTALALDKIILTTETAHNLPVAKRLDIITAEVVIGMHLFKDIASAFRDTFGGRSKVMQNGLKDARKMALEELRVEALALGADAVVGVALNYSEVSGAGKSMLFLVASGTAVKLKVP